MNIEVKDGHWDIVITEVESGSVVLDVRKQAWLERVTEGICTHGQSVMEPHTGECMCHG